MRHEVRALAMPATGQNGASTSVRDLTNCCVLIDGTGAGGFSVKVQGKISGPAANTQSSAWFDLTGAITASTLVPLDRIASSDLGGYSIPFTDIRIVSTTTGNPAPIATVAGYNTRTA